jgi:hypothetical protein
MIGVDMMKKFIIALLLGVSLILAPGLTIKAAETTITVSAFAEIPDTPGNIEYADDSQMTASVNFIEVSGTNLYDLYISHPNGATYILKNVDLPGKSELGKSPLNPGILYTDDDVKYLYYEFQNKASDKPIYLDIEENIYGFRPFVNWNTSSGAYILTEKLSIMGVVSYDGRLAYLDLLFNINLDDLLQIEFKYDYRYQYVWSTWGEMKTSTDIRYKGQSVNVTSLWSKIFIIPGAFPAGISYTEHVSFDDALNEINPTQNYQTEYTTKINNKLLKEDKELVTESALFDSNYSMYRVLIDKFDAFGSTGFEIADDIAILDILYQYQGVYYHVPYDDIDSIIVGAKVTDVDYLISMFADARAMIDGLIVWAQENVGSIGVVILGVIAIILAPYVLMLLRLIVWIIKKFIKGIVILVKLPFKIIRFLIVPLHVQKQKKE